MRELADSENSAADCSRSNGSPAAGTAIGVTDRALLKPWWTTVPVVTPMSTTMRMSSVLEIFTDL
jgi:hypothetical protein